MLKIHSERLRRAGWALELTLKEARNNGELISLADSQVLRWIDELNGIEGAEASARELKREIRLLRRGENTAEARREIKKLYARLDALQYKPDYMCLIIDRNRDYYRACKGFSVNGIEYRRLLGTNGGIKNSTIVFVSARLHDELERRIENGRDMTKPLVTAKLESYRALTCSASVPVSMPRGIAVVNDAETSFISDMLSITDEGSDEPVITEKHGEPVTMDASDGYGLMLPSLAERWSAELGLGYRASAVNTRFSFEKGVLTVFDFVEFAERVAGRYTFTDAWGNEVDVRNVEAIFTTSMVKLWDSYASCEDYLRTSLSNGYTFGISKNSPERLEDERHLNYQFIQSYHLSDEDIDELIGPTMRELEDVMDGDWRKAVLFARGIGLNERNVPALKDDYIKAIMADERIFDDPFVKNSLNQLIKGSVRDAKVGVLKIHGNYSIITGDPYLLCESIFGLEPKGLLSAGEIYNRYWADDGAEVLACFRAPMTSMNNIRLVKVSRSPEAAYWYRYLETTTVFNGWDLCAAALNGCDFDGDIVMLTDNQVLIGKHRDLPVLMCAQKRAQKRISEETDFVKSNIASFGNDIGRTTNWITSMFEVQSRFEEDSVEYKTLEYRILTGQLFQQNAIDKAKGIICKPMPKYWHDRHALKTVEDDRYRALCGRISAYRKPYFMIYIYPSLMRSYNSFVKKSDSNAERRFGKSLEELLGTSEAERSGEENTFVKYYESRMPVGTGDCAINRICRRFEDAFDGRLKRYSGEGQFDYTIMKTDMPYSRWQYDRIRSLYRAYNQHVQSYSSYIEYEHVSSEDAQAMFEMLDAGFKEECLKVCPDEEALCNIVLDICYTRSATRRFAWNMCGEQIVWNLLKNNGGVLRYPHQDPDGDIEFCGKRFSVEEVHIADGCDTEREEMGSGADTGEKAGSETVYDAEDSGEVLF